MENTEWRMENGEWRIQNGEWRMENGEWRMENGDGDHAMVAAASFPRIAVAATLVVASCVSAGTSSVAAIILTTE